MAMHAWGWTGKGNAQGSEWKKWMREILKGMGLKGIWKEMGMWCGVERENVVRKEISMGKFRERRVVRKMRSNRRERWERGRKGKIGMMEYGQGWPCIYEVKWVVEGVSLKGVGRNECGKHGGWKCDEMEWLGQWAWDGSGNGGQPCMHGSMHVGRKWVVGENGYDYVGGYGYDGGNGYGDVEKRVVTGSWVDMHEEYEIWTWWGHAKVGRDGVRGVEREKVMRNEVNKFGIGGWRYRWLGVWGRWHAWDKRKWICLDVEREDMIGMGINMAMHGHANVRKDELDMF